MLKKLLIVGVALISLLIVAVFSLRCYHRNKPIIPQRIYEFTFGFKPEVLEPPSENEQFAHAHVGRQTGGSRIRKMPSVEEGFFLFGGDYHFSIDASWGKTIPESTVAIRDCIKARTVSEGEKQCRGRGSPVPYHNQPCLLLFGQNNQLTKILPLKHRLYWYVMANGKEIPLGLYLRHKLASSKQILEPPFKITLSLKQTDQQIRESTIEIVLTNTGDSPRTIYYPKEIMILLAIADAYFDVYNSDYDLLENYKRPTITPEAVEAIDYITLGDYKTLQPGEIVVYELSVSDLAKLFRPPPQSGQYSVCFHLHAALDWYPVEYTGPGYVNAIKRVDSWKGYIQSNPIVFEIASGLE